MAAAWWKPASWFGRKADANDTLELFREIYGGAAAKVGVPVTMQTAIQCGAAFACARVIAEGLSQIPFRLMRSQNGRREAAADVPLHDLLDTAPNDWMTSVEFFDTIGLHLVFAGNAFVWKNTVRGEVRELLPFEPRMVEVDFKNWTPTYKVTDADGKRMEIPAAEMWHIRGPSINGWFGLEGVKVAREAIGLSVTAEEHAAVTLANAAAPAGILTTDQTLSADQRKSLREAWQSVHGGRINQGKIAVLSNGMKFVPISSDAESSQLLETRRFAVEEVCRPLRVMPIMVGYSDKTATYASAEQMFLAHVVHTMGPWYRRIEKSASVALLTPEQRQQGLYFKFFAQALLRGAAKDRAEFYTRMVASGLMSPNECRELEDLNPYAGGNTFVRQVNMGAIGADGNTVAPAAPEPTPVEGAEPVALSKPNVDKWTADDRRHVETLSVLSSIEEAMQKPIVVNVPELKTPVIHVHAAEQEPPVVQLSVPQQAAPVVNVAAPEVKVEVDPTAILELKKQADKPWPVETEVIARDDKGRPSKYTTRPVE